MAVFAVMLMEGADEGQQAAARALLEAAALEGHEANLITGNATHSRPSESIRVLDASSDEVNDLLRRADVWLNFGS